MFLTDKKDDRLESRPMMWWWLIGGVLLLVVVVNGSICVNAMANVASDRVAAFEQLVWLLPLSIVPAWIFIRIAFANSASILQRVLAIAGVVLLVCTLAALKEYWGQGGL